MLYTLLRKLKLSLFFVTLFFAIFMFAVIMILTGTQTTLFIIIAIVAIVSVYVTFHFFKKVRFKMMSVFTTEHTVETSFQKDERQVIEVEKIKNATRIALKCRLQNGTKANIPDYVVEAYGETTGFEGVMNAPAGTKIKLRPFIDVVKGDIVQIQAFFKVEKEIIVLIKKNDNSVGLIPYNNVLTE